MLKVSRVAPHEWVFERPRLEAELTEEFDRGCELYEEGNLGEAEKVFTGVLARMPDHLDAIHHLALVYWNRDSFDQALVLWEQAVRIGRKAFPEDFQRGRDRLEWGWLENRPFLRCLHGLALVRRERGDAKEALELFQELLSLNPDDNQGARAMAQAVLFELGRFQEALAIARRYPRDIMPDTLYGRALALFKLGRRRDATVALKKAVERFPLVTKELLKTRHRLPRTARPGVVTVGGTDEAYYYWEEWGRFWAEDREALEWLRGLASAGVEKASPASRRRT